VCFVSSGVGWFILQILASGWTRELSTGPRNSVVLLLRNVSAFCSIKLLYPKNRHQKSLVIVSLGIFAAIFVTSVEVSLYFPVRNDVPAAFEGGEEKRVFKIQAPIIIGVFL
jgi:hypothetical protein